MGQPFRASEFPNDNAAICSGAIWVYEDPIGPPTIELSEASFEPVPSASFVLYFEDDDACVSGPVELDVASDGRLSVAVSNSTHESVPDASAAAPPVPEPTAFSQFESALVSALLAQGATRSAALVPQLLRLEQLTPDALSKEVLLTLQSRGYLDGSGRYSSKYRDVCKAWVTVLRGETKDFSACGTTTLDRFGADLLAALLAVPATRAEELRRGLRKVGIAAFGVLDAA